MLVLAYILPNGMEPIKIVIQEIGQELVSLNQEIGSMKAANELE